MMASFAQNDISPLLFFYFWEPIYYLLDATEQSFPGKSKKKRGRWAGVSEDIGPKMCFKIVDDDSGEIIQRSTIRSANKPGTANLQVDPLEPPPVVTDKQDVLDDFMPVANFATPFHAQQ